MKTYIKSLNEFINETLYHGSPYSFDKFDNTQINNGIGGQAFGYGFYFTDDKKTAKGYAETLEKIAEVTIDKIKPSNIISKYVSQIIDLHGNKPDLVLHILKVNSKQLLNDNKITDDEYNFIQNASKLKATRNRYLYEVEIPEGDYLNWTKIITDEQLSKINIPGLKKDTGMNVYLKIAKMTSYKEASQILLKSGIIGTKYPANYGYEYVIFDPSMIKIIKKTNF